MLLLIYLVKTDQLVKHVKTIIWFRNSLVGHVIGLLLFCYRRPSPEISFSEISFYCELELPMIWLRHLSL